MNAKDFEAECKGMNSSPEAKKRSDAAKAHAFSEFRKHFPRADVSKFTARGYFDSNRKALGRVLFLDGDGSWENPLIEDRKYWSKPLKDPLGIHQDGGFPMPLTPLKRTKQTQMPIPAVYFCKEIDKFMQITNVLNKELKIYVTTTQFFTTKFREIFLKTQMKFTTSKYGRKWLAGPNLSFWPQQLNFALWWATTGCGISRDILFPTGYLNLSPGAFVLSLPRLFHSKANTIRNRWGRECILFTGRSHI